MYSMKETGQMVNMSYQTLKYYCNEGLIPNLKRDKNNYRVFDDNDIAWIKGLICLKQCGMSIQEMKEYMNLCLEGKDSIPIRIKMLEKKQEQLYSKLEKIQESIDYINYKKEFYNDILAGKKAYFSYLKK